MFITIDWHQFTPWVALLGGVFVGVAAVVFVLFNGRILGISGILGGLFTPKVGDVGWRVAFLAGIAAAPILATLTGHMPTMHIDADWPAVILAGLLVGIGTRYGGGCTSGHGVCGMSRLSMRSMIATLVFMGAGFATVYVLRHAFV